MRRARESVDGGASEGAEGVVFVGTRKSFRKGSFGVELKSFEVEVEEQKGKV